MTNHLLATDKGFYTAASNSIGNGTSCSVPITFNALPRVVSTNITSGDIVYDVQVSSTASAMPNQTFTVTFILRSTACGPLCIKDSSTPMDGQVVDCKFDLGTNLLPSSPYAFRVVIQ